MFFLNTIIIIITMLFRISVNLIIYMYELQVDSAAASAIAASGMTGEGLANSKNPSEGVRELVSLTLTSSWGSFRMKFKKVKSMIKNGTVWTKMGKWFKKALTKRINIIKSRLWPSNPTSNSSNGGHNDLTPQLV